MGGIFPALTLRLKEYSSRAIRESLKRKCTQTVSNLSSANQRLEPLRSDLWLADEVSLIYIFYAALWNGPWRVRHAYQRQTRMARFVHYLVVSNRKEMQGGILRWPWNHTLWNFSKIIIIIIMLLFLMGLRKIHVPQWIHLLIRLKCIVACWIITAPRKKISPPQKRRKK